MTADRMRRVDEAMREVLSGAITSELKDPRVGFVTVTAVNTAPDLRHARVFVSVLGTDPVRRRSLDGLRSAHGYLQRRVADELHLKHTPTLDFVYDDTLDRATRIGELIEREAEDVVPPSDQRTIRCPRTAPSQLASRRSRRCAITTSSS